MVQNVYSIRLTNITAKRWPESAATQIEPIRIFASGSLRKECDVYRVRAVLNRCQCGRYASPSSTDVTALRANSNGASSDKTTILRKCLTSTVPDFGPWTFSGVWSVELGVYTDPLFYPSQRLPRRSLWRRWIPRPVNIGDSPLSIRPYLVPNLPGLPANRAFCNRLSLTFSPVPNEVCCSNGKEKDLVPERSMREPGTKLPGRSRSGFGLRFWRSYSRLCPTRRAHNARSTSPASILSDNGFCARLARRCFERQACPSFELDRMGKPPTVSSDFGIHGRLRQNRRAKDFLRFLKDLAFSLRIKSRKALCLPGMNQIRSTTNPTHLWPANVSSLCQASA